MPTAVERSAVDSFHQLFDRFVGEGRHTDNLGLDNKLLNFTLNFADEGPEESHLGQLLPAILPDQHPTPPAVSDFFV